jgi:hypothetical protein
LKRKWFSFLYNIKVTLVTFVNINHLWEVYEEKRDLQLDNLWKAIIGAIKIRQWCLFSNKRKIDTWSKPLDQKRWYKLFVQLKESQKYLWLIYLPPVQGECKGVKERAESEKGLG